MAGDIYNSSYLERLKTLSSKRAVIVDVIKNRRNLSKGAVAVLVRNLERPERTDLARVNPLIVSMLIENLISGTDTLAERVSLFESYGISKYVVYELLFWMKPSTYPFPCEDIDDYDGFRKRMRSRLKESSLGNYLELYALESAEREKFICEVFEKLTNVKPETLADNLWLKDFVGYLSPVDKVELKRKLHPYVWRVLTAQRIASAVVIDGSNVLMQSELRGPERIDSLLEKISTLPEVYFPFYIVFDLNAKYKFSTRYFEYKWTYYHSPADELIVSLCMEKGAVVCSKDRFREYEMPVKNIWYEIFSDRKRRK